MGGTQNPHKLHVGDLAPTKEKGKSLPFPNYFSHSRGPGKNLDHNFLHKTGSRMEVR